MKAEMEKDAGEVYGCSIETNLLSLSKNLENILDNYKNHYKEEEKDL